MTPIRSYRLFLSALPLLISGVLALYSCKKNPDIENRPTIELLEAGPSQIKANVDSIYFRISYKDGNGDLGTGDPSSYNLFVTDNRIALEYKYRIRELVPDNAAVPISGVLSFSISNTVLTSSSATEENVSYSIWVTDEEGNQSNKLTTATLKVVK